MYCKLFSDGSMFAIAIRFEEISEAKITFVG